MTSTITDPYRVLVPEGQRGEWRVERFTITEQEAKFANIRAILHPEERVAPGSYTRLMRGREVVMSDTPMERMGHEAMVRHASGHILILGLGLGMVLQACLEKRTHTLIPPVALARMGYPATESDLVSPAVEHATVVEKSPEVLGLVGAYYRERYGNRVMLVEADALTWRPPAGAHYSAVWGDIWDSICTDNLPEMTRLKRRYSRRADWVGCWAEAEVRVYARREQRGGW